MLLHYCPRVATVGDIDRRLPESAAASRAFDLAARVVPPALCVIAAVLILASGWRSGGYFPEDYLTVGAISLLACAVGLVAAGEAWRPKGPALVVLGSALGLAAWSGLSAAWSPDPGAAVLAMARTLGYAAAFLLALLAVGNGRRAALLLRLVIAALVVISVGALLSRLQPELFTVDPLLLSTAQGRLSYPITYWNGLGAIAAMACLGCAGLAADAREQVVVRGLAAAGGTLAACTLFLTISRGAGLALIAGLSVVLVLSPRRTRLAASCAGMFGAATLGVLVLRAHPALVDQPGPIAQQSDEGAGVLVILLLLALASAGLQVALARVPQLNRSATRSRRGRGSRHRRAMPVAAGALPAALVLLLFAGIYATSSDTLEGQTLDATTSVRSFFDRQVDAFMDSDKALSVPTGQERLTTSRSSRSEGYRVAIDGFQAHPLAGDGAGGYTARWIRERQLPEYFRNAHSLELETASDLGLVGLLLLAGIVVPLGAGLRGVRRARGVLTRSQASAAGGIVAVWLFHSATDWDWQLGAVTLPALMCGALLVAPSRSRGRFRSRRLPNAIAVGGAHAGHADAPHH